ncbi:hypothetical protein BpHYR1_028579 [Brachionus plicatilis]|uniref:Uncharacterized protein n=1 Tax=Brachionus plicatilis TaxID=10195 RepID=A0A3M7QT18_BRAPC|nr:hypothetical protein BpHYR1_028579 [Brachionus plicatilis]
MFDTNKVVASKFLAVNLDICELALLWLDDEYKEIFIFSLKNMSLINLIFGMYPRIHQNAFLYPRFGITIY